MQSTVEQAIEKEQELNLIEETGAETAIFELIDRVNSGFVRIGTEKLADPDELNVAGYRQILTTSAYQVPKKGNVKGFEKIHIRYRASSTDIDPAKQDRSGHFENSENDRILFKNGRLVVVNEGGFEGLFSFLRNDSRNETNPRRIPSAQAIYREIFPDKEVEDDNLSVFAEAEALSFINTLITDRTVGKVKYDSPRLNALAQFFRVVADTPAGQMRGLIATAKLDGAKFLRAAKEFEQQSATDIIHGERLQVLSFQDTRVILVPKDQVLINFSSKLSKEDQVMQLAAYFQSPEGMNHAREFAIELKLAKEKGI